MPTKAHETINVTPHSAGRVASVTGVDFQTLSDDQLGEIPKLLAKYLVLEFPNSYITQEQQLTITRRLGEVSGESADHLRITAITNKGEYGDYELDWHTDGYFNKIGPKYGILNAITISPTAVKTSFCDMLGLWNDVGEDIKAELRGKVICNDTVFTQYGRPRGQNQPIGEHFRTWPHVEHPVVHRDPSTGKEALHLGARKWSFVKDVEQARSDEILEKLWKMVDSGKYTFGLDWQEGTMVIWRNDILLHFRPKGDGLTRLLDRSWVPGKALIAA
ncbi:Clavaminate synthase-like protein [Myriangium duriaei CBS 260.36]|uniref:Clavaminate synthase-like protein n=1 Tax=Myriangium duriaei CBS 260.36 TaxID=1168546 RepID=A0A9P4MT47_9PEZI|nr:Clavaminate synthase-like protein [Myriangium duriaei CBS 260.36]